MKFQKNTPDLFDLFVGLIIVMAIGAIVSAPITGYFSAKGIQKALKQECNGDYSLMEVALNGDKLIEICRIKNQQFTVK